MTFIPKKSIICPVCKRMFYQSQGYKKHKCIPNYNSSSYEEASLEVSSISSAEEDHCDDTRRTSSCSSLSSMDDVMMYGQESGACNADCVDDSKSESSADTMMTYSDIHGRNTCSEETSSEVFDYDLSYEDEEPTSSNILKNYCNTKKWTRVHFQNYILYLLW